MQQQQSSDHWLDCSQVDFLFPLDHEQGLQIHPLAPSLSQDDFDRRPQSTSFPPSVDNEQDNYTLPPTPVDNYLPLTPLNQQPVPLSSSFDENVYLDSEAQTDVKDKLDEHHADEEIGDITFYCNTNQFSFQNRNEDVSAYPNGMHRIESCTSNALSDDTDTSFTQQMSIEENRILVDDSDFEDYNLSYGPQSCSSVQSYENTGEYDSLINQQDEPLSSNWQPSHTEQNIDLENILAKSYPQFNQLIAKRKEEVCHPCDRPSKKRCLSLGERNNRHVSGKNFEGTNAADDDQTATSSSHHSLRGMEEVPFTLDNHSFLPWPDSNIALYVQPPQSSAQPTNILHQAPCRMRHSSFPGDLLRTGSGNFFESSFNNVAVQTNTMTADINGNFPEPHNNLQKEASNIEISDQCSNHVKTEQEYNSASTESLAPDRFHCQNANTFDINLQSYLQFNETCPSTANRSSIPFLPVSDNNINTDGLSQPISPVTQPVSHFLDSSNSPDEELSAQIFIHTPNAGNMQAGSIPAIPTSSVTQFTNQPQTTNQTNHLDSNGQASFSYLHSNINNSSTEDAFVPDSQYCLDDLSQYLSTTNENNHDRFISRSTDYITGTSDLFANLEVPRHENSVPLQRYHDKDAFEYTNPELIGQACGPSSNEAAEPCKPCKLSQFLNGTKKHNNLDKFITAEYITGSSNLLANFEEPKHQISVPLQLCHDKDAFESKNPELIGQDCGPSFKGAATPSQSNHSQKSSTRSLTCTPAESESFDLPRNVDPGVKEAFLKGVETGQIMPLLKQELKMRILSRRNKEGKEDIDITYVPPRQNELTEEEKKKKKHRQNLNKIAAAKHRQTKKNKQENLEEECILLEEKNTKLKEIVKEVEMEIQKIKDNLVQCGFKVILTH